MHSSGPPTRDLPVLTPTLVLSLIVPLCHRDKARWLPQPSTTQSRARLFLPEQIFVFDGFALRANSLGHLEQIKSYAPGHQVRFGSLNYTADIRGDLIFNGFGTAAIAPPHSDERDLNLSSDQIQVMVTVTATALDPEKIAPSEAIESAALEPHTDSTPCNICVNGTPDSSLAISSGPCTPADTELDRLSIFEFSTQTSSSTHLWVMC